MLFSVFLSAPISTKTKTELPLELVFIKALSLSLTQASTNQQYQDHYGVSKVTDH